MKHDVIPESLKNMLLVMETTGLFNKDNTDVKFSQLCSITKDRIESFLPGLWEDLFKGNFNAKKEEVTAAQNKPIGIVSEQMQPTEPDATSDSEYTVISKEMEDMTMTTTAVNEIEAQQAAPTIPMKVFYSNAKINESFCIINVLCFLLNSRRVLRCKTFEFNRRW